MWGGLLQLLPDPTAAPWGDGLPLSSLALTSPHAKALVCMEDTNSHCSEFPDPSHTPLPGVACLGGPPPLTRISPLQFSHPPAPRAKAGENEAVATAETEAQR